MLPELATEEIAIIATLIAVVIAARLAGNETRTLLLVLTAVTMAPAATEARIGLAVVAGILSVLLKWLDLFRKSM